MERHTDGGRLQQSHPSGRKATASATRRPGTTKAAQRTGVNKAASDAKGNDVASRDNNSKVDANDDTNNDAKRAGQPKKVGEYGGQGVRAVTAPSGSDDNPDSSVNKAAMPRATNKADKATRDGAWHGCAASACKSTGRQVKARAAHHDHGADKDDYDIDAAGGCKSEAQIFLFLCSSNQLHEEPGQRVSAAQILLFFCSINQPHKEPGQHGSAAQISF